MTALLNKISKSAPTPSGLTEFLRDSPTKPLTCHDRCDCSALQGDASGHGYLGSCGAQAQVRVTMATGSQIVFCGHHFTEHGPRISQAAVVYDERRLSEVEAAPALLNQPTPAAVREVTS
jgi:hypothetical protein